MSGLINTGGVHHLRLTVTDVNRSRDFYTSLLGFDVAVDSPPSDNPKAEETYPVLWGGCVLVRGSLLLGLRPVAAKGDTFDEDRVGLDHLSFSVATHAELEDAVRLFDQRKVPHGPIVPLAGFGISVLPFRDPDNIQVELTAPLA
ncbi:MAG: VOC family protein [Candidatus Dormibacteraceae bacterium]